MGGARRVAARLLIARDHVDVTKAGKLVRDGIPDIVRASGAEPVVRKLPPQERLPALFAKLREESDELVDATTTAEQAEELADIYEVLTAVAAEVNLSWDTILHIAAEKRVERGGFAEGIWMEIG